MYESCQKHITPNCSCTNLVLCGFMCASGLEARHPRPQGAFPWLWKKRRGWKHGPTLHCALYAIDLWSRGKQLILIPENLNRGRDWDSRETKLTVSRRTSLEVICHRHIWKFWSWKFMKPRCKGAVRCYPLTSQILQRFCWETVSLIDVEWLRSNQWEGALLRRNFHSAI